MTLPVWMYWEGERPLWIEECERTVRAHATDVRVVGREEFDGLRDADRDINLSTLCTAHRADFVRAFLLAKHGGLWIDSDCVVLRPLEPLLNALEHYDFLGYKERQGHVSNNLMGAGRESRNAAAYYERVCGLLRSGQPLEWLSLGSYALTDTLRESGVAWHRLGYDLVQPICWSHPAAFFARGERDEHRRNFNERAFCYMLSNNMVQGYQSEHPDETLTAPDTFFSYLLSRAFDEKKEVVKPRRSSVGTSNWQQIPFCIDAMMDVEPMRVLDVGIGFGRWGMLVREFCEEWKGRMYRENWKVQLEGIEAFPKNVEEYHHLFYNWIHIGDGADIIARMTDRWHLIIFGDVLEHWYKDDALKVLEKALDISDYVLINIPVGPGWERGAMYDNPYEEHKSSWETEEFTRMQPVRYDIFKEYNNRDYGAFLLSRDDPRSLRR